MTYEDLEGEDTLQRAKWLHNSAASVKYTPDDDQEIPEEY